MNAIAIDATASTQLQTGPLFDLDGKHALAVALGRIAIRLDLYYLYASALKHYKQEREAVLSVADHLINETRLDLFDGMAPPPDFVLDGPPCPTASIEAYFYYAQYEYTDQEIQRLHQVFAAGVPTRYALVVCRRLANEIADLVLQNPEVPNFEDGWIPTKEQIRNCADDKPVFMIVRADEKPALLVLRTSNIREVQEKQRQSRR